MNVREITEVLRREYPEKYFEKWDSAGIQVEFKEREVRKIIVALEADDYVTDEAVKIGADLIVTHHPLIFSGLKSISDGDVVGRRVMKLVSAGVSLYSMHTNYDNLFMGRDAAEVMKLTDSEVFIEGMDGYGIGMVGNLPREMSVSELCGYVKNVFNLKTVALYGHKDERVSRVAVVPGSGKEFYPDALKRGANVLITGDVSHHFGVDAVMAGCSIIDAGHYGLEHIFVDIMGERLGRLFKDADIVKILSDNPIEYI